MVGLLALGQGSCILPRADLMLRATVGLSHVRINCPVSRRLGQRKRHESQGAARLATPHCRNDLTRAFPSLACLRCFRCYV